MVLARRLRSFRAQLSTVLGFLFRSPIVGDKKAYALFRGGVGSFVASNPATVVAHVQTMCRNFSELSTVYSQKELDQGLWAVFGAGISCEQYLFDSSLDLGLRAACIESMYLPFRDVVAHTVIDKRQSVQAFLDIHQSELNDDDLEWVLACRDGKIA